MGLRILDRYILREMAGPFAIGLVVYSFFFLINLLFQLAGLVIQQGLSASASGVLFLLSLPNLLSYTIPVALLVGTIIAYGRLSADSEIVAMRAGGLRGAAFLRAPLLFGTALFALLLAFNLWLIPACRAQSDRIQTESAQALNLVRLLKPGAFFDRVPGVLLYARSADVGAGRYEGVFVFNRTGPSVDILTLADYGRVVRSPESGTLTFLLEKGETIQFNRKTPGKVQVATFEEQALTVETAPDTAKSQRKSLTELSTRELLGRLRLPQGNAGIEEAERIRNGLSYELHRRLATAFAALIFVLVGVPLGMVNLRGGKGAGFSLSLIVLLVYWILLSALADLAVAGKVRPEVAAWFPDALLLFAGLLFLARKDRMAEPLWMRPFLLLFPSREPSSAGTSPRGRFRLGAGLKILDRYLLGQMLRYAFLIGLSVLLLDWIIEIRGLSEFLSGADKGKVLFKYLLARSPEVLTLLAPLAVLMTVLVTFGILERTNELTALKASGISLFRLCLPALALGAAAGFLTWGFQEAVVPAASRKALNLRDKLKNYTARNVASTMDVWLFAPDRGALFHYNHYDARAKSFQGFSVYGLEPDRFRIRSRTFLKRSSFSEKTSLEYAKGWKWDRGVKPAFEDLAPGRLDVKLPLDYFVLPPQREGRYFSSSELKRLIRRLEERGFPADQQRMDYYKKFSEGGAPLVLLLAGLPFAFLAGRRGSLYGIAIALLLVVGFYTLSAVFNSVGVMAWLDPALAAWAPAFLFACAGGFLLLNLRT